MPFHTYTPLETDYSQSSLKGFDVLPGILSLEHDIMQVGRLVGETGSLNEARRDDEEWKGGTMMYRVTYRSHITGVGYTVVQAVHF